MKKHLLVWTLALCLISLLLPATVLAAETHEVGDAEALAQAVEDAASGDVIQLTADIDLEQRISLTKSLTIDGSQEGMSGENGEGCFTITSTEAGEGGRIFNVDDSCAADAVITLQNIRLVGNTSGTYTRGVSLYQTNNVTLHLDNVYLSSNYYALNIASENTDFQATIENSTLSGWCALQTWSSGVDVAISNSTLLGTNDKTLGPSNSFSTLVINDGVQDAVIALEGCQVKAVTTTGNRQNILSLQNGSQEEENNPCNNTISFTDCTFSAEGTWKDPDSKTEIGQLIPLWYFVGDDSDQVSVDGRTIYMAPPAPGYANVSPFEEIATLSSEPSMIYVQLEDALAAAKDNDTVTVLKDVEVTAPLVLQDKQNITLDLGGNKVSNPKGNVLITKNASVTIENGEIYTDNPSWIPAVGADSGSVITIADDATVTGTYGVGIDCYIFSTKDEYKANVPTAGKDTEIHIYGTVQGASTESLLATGGTVAVSISGNVNSKEAGNYAAIHVYDGATLTGYEGNSGNANYDDGPAVYAAGYGQWIIEDGATLTGGEALNIKSGKFTIEGGQFTANGKYFDPATSWSNGTEATGAAVSVTYHSSYARDVELTILGGQFESANGYALYESDTEKQQGNAMTELAISGGQFSGKTGAVFSKHEQGFITGGQFSADPTAYVAAGYVATAGTEAGYPYQVQLKTADTIVVKPATKEPVLNQDSIEDPVAQQVAQTIAAPTIVDAANQTTLTDSTKQAAVELAQKELGLPEEAEVILYTQTYLDITATGYDAEQKTLTMDIKPMMQVVASTAATADEIVEDGAGKNAVPYGEPEVLKVEQPTAITLQLPSGFVTAGETVYIKHQATEKSVYFYKAIAGAQGEISFTSYHGFSPFTFSLVNEAVAEIGEIGYDSLQAAVDAAQTGDVITLLQDNAEEVTVRRTVSFTLQKADGVTFTGSIKAGSNTTAGKDNGTDGQYTFTRRNSGGGGSAVSASYGIAVVDGIVNGTVSVSVQTAAAGDTVTITVTPAAGYQVATVTVTDANGKTVAVNAQTGGKYTFTMPSAKVEINATFVASAGLPFTDVAADAWYYEAVEYVYNADLMNGVSDALFAPDQTTTRGMVVTVLYRLAGNPAISAGSETFNDVQAGQYYADAAIWAANNGIVNGYGDGSFGPEDLITREQLAAIFYRYSSAQGYDVTASGDLSQFSDAGTISAYAEPALAWANGAGLINGRGNGLEPQANATRAEIATMLMRFCQSVAQ